MKEVMWQNQEATATRYFEKALEEENKINRK